ncbi:hypothetical protein ACP70R_033004 [Stipagrostis hirtigluma subsp. patula]
MASAASTLTVAAAFAAVCAVLACSSPGQEPPSPANCTNYCGSQCNPTCIAAASSYCEGLKNSVLLHCPDGCYGGCSGSCGASCDCASMCSSACRSSAESAYMSCQQRSYATVYKPCWSSCNGSCYNNCMTCGAMSCKNN